MNPLNKKKITVIENLMKGDINHGQLKAKQLKELREEKEDYLRLKRVETIYVRMGSSSSCNCS